MGGIKKAVRKIVGGSSSKSAQAVDVAPEVVPQAMGSVGAESAADVELERQRKRAASGRGDTILTGTLGDTSTVNTGRGRTLG